MPKSVFTDAYATMCANLVAVRKAAGVSRVELARRLGKEQPFVSKIERGERRVDALELYAIARALRLEPSAFFASLIAGLPEQVPV